MNALPFELKRAHVRVTWKTIATFQELARFDPLYLLLTPARLDILDLIDQRLSWTKPLPGFAPSMPFGDIAPKLGLARPTISRCVIRMEALGLVRRFPDELNRRRTIVALTELGIRALGLGRCASQSIDDLLQAASRPDESLAARCRELAQWFGSRAARPYDEGYLDGV